VATKNAAADAVFGELIAVFPVIEGLEVGGELFSCAKLSRLKPKAFANHYYFSKSNYDLGVR
jgi:hypothetical protein